MSNGKLCVISGSTGGIGGVVVKTLWHAGYSILALGYSPDKVNALNDWFYDNAYDNRYGFALALNLDHPTDLWRVDNLLQSTLKKAPPALLVTCHGAAPMPGPALYAAEALRKVVEIDLFGTYSLCALVGRYMIERRAGSIVFLSSIHSQMTYPERLPYCVAKNALSGMTRALAVEWGRYGISVNTICPWQVRGERSQRFADVLLEETGEDLYELYRRRSPMRKLIEPEDIAETVLWLARTPSVSGQEIILDGALSRSMWYRSFTEQP